MKQFLIGLDQWINTWFGGMADETISARAHRKEWVRVERFINFLFRDEHHCLGAYLSELKRTQLPKEYRDGT